MIENRQILLQGFAKSYAWVKDYLLALIGQYPEATGAAFLDVPVNHFFYTEIGKFSVRGGTVGVGVSPF